jgi:hypothetical protein
LTQENKQGNSFNTEVVRIDEKTESPVCRVEALVKHSQERGLEDKKCRERRHPLSFLNNKRRLTLWRMKPFSLRRQNLQAV